MTDKGGLHNGRLAWHEERARRLRRTEGEGQPEGCPIPLLEEEQVSDLDPLGGVTLKKVPATWEIRERDTRFGRTPLGVQLLRSKLPILLILFRRAMKEGHPSPKEKSPKEILGRLTQGRRRK
jgi:hypothetical protein